MSKPFQFKQFIIHQERAAFKVGTDSAVLGAWAGISGALRILDIGTGTGLLALMCAQRNTSAIIRGIEQDALSVSDAEMNFLASPWAPRLQVIQGDVLSFPDKQFKFDYFICNPPYFLDSLKSPDTRKSDARHTETGWFEALVSLLDQQAAEEAVFGAVMPEALFMKLDILFKKQAWHLIRSRKVLPGPGKNRTRILAEWGKTPNAECKEPDLYIRNATGNYSEEYLELLRDFYLFIP